MDELRLRRSLATVRNMLRARGYEVDEPGVEFYAHKDGESLRVKVVPKVGVEELRRFEEEGGGILLTDDAWSARAAAEARVTENLTVRGTQIDIFSNPLVPPHRIVPAGDAPVRKELLPRMHADDPCALYIGAKPGDVVRIERWSPTAGVTPFWRCVVKT